MTTRQVIPSPSEVGRSPELFARHMLKIMDKRDQMIPLIYNPLQLHYLKNRTNRDIILKARQIGFSTAIQAEHFRYAITRPSRILTLMDKAENTQNMRDMADRFYTNFPLTIEHDGQIIQRPVRGKDSATVTTYPQLGSKVVMATAGSVDTGRSGSYRFMHGSEVAFWLDADKTVAGALQAGSPQWVVMESTPNGAQGWFYLTCMEALDGKGVWRLHFYPWFKNPEYQSPLEDGEGFDYTDDELKLIKAHGLTPQQIKWRRSKIKEVKERFIQEYPEDPRSCFLLSGRGYFGDIEHCYKAPTGATPQQGHKYVAGLDWGQIEDWTVMPIGDAQTREQVEIVRIHQMPYPDIRKHLISRLRHWGVSTVYAESNSASGNVDSLRREAYEAGLRLTIIGYETSNESKAVDMSALRDALTEGVLKLLPDDIQKAEMRALQVTQTAHNNWRIAAAPGQHDDIPIGNMLMRKALAWGHNYIPPKVR